MAKLALLRLFQQLFHVGRPGAGGRRPGTPARRKCPAPLLAVEVLEDRTLLDATLQAITLAGSTFPASSAAAGLSNNASVSAGGRYVAFESTAPNLVDGQGNTAITDNVFLFDRVTGTNTLVSHRFGSATTGGDHSSYDAVISGNGQFVYYLSLADDLVQGQPQFTGVPDSLTGQELFVYDVANQTTRLVTHDYQAPNQPANGSTGLTYLGVSTGPPVSVSSDGTLATYASEATDLAPGITGSAGFQRPNVFVYNYNDGAAGTNTLVSHQVNAPTAAVGGLNPVVSAAGGYLAYVAVLSLNGAPVDNVLLYNVAAGTYTLVSRQAGTTFGSGNGKSDTPVLAQVGSSAYVAFRSDATNLVPGQSGAAGNVFLYDGAANTVGLVSTVFAGTTQAAGGVPFSNIIDALPISMSADGQDLVYQSAADDVLLFQRPNPPGTTTNVYLWKFGAVQLGTITGFNYLVSANPAGPNGAADGSSQLPVLSGDGSTIAFGSRADNLVPGQSSTGSTFNVFEASVAAVIANLSSSTYVPPTLVSGADGSPRVTANAASGGGVLEGDPSSFYESSLALSNDGGSLVFDSSATNLSPAIFKANANTDIFEYTGAAGGLTLVSRRAAPVVTADGNSYVASVSADEHDVAFVSDALNLVPGQQNNHFGLNVFLRDNNTGAVTLVNHTPGSAATTGDAGVPEAPFTPDPADGMLVPPPPAASLLPALSADGNSVAFVSADTDLVRGQNGPAGYDNVFLFDARTGAVTLVSHIPGQASTTGAYDSNSPAVSSDGRFVAYVSNGGVYLFDAEAPLQPTLISASGSNPSISDDGRHVAYLSGGNVYLYDLGIQTSTLVSHALGSTAAGNAASSSPVLSADGSSVAYVSLATDLVFAGGVQPNVDNVYLYSRASGTNLLLTGSFGNPANGNSDSPVIDTDGSAVAYRSDATDLVAGETGAAGNVFLFSRATGTTLVSAVTGASSTGAGGSSAPAIDGDGGKVVYLSSAADLVANQEPGTTTTNVYLYAAPLGDNFLITGQFGSATVPGNGDASNALISRQSYPLLSSVATDLVPGVGAHSNGFLNKLISTNLLLTGPALRGGTGPNALVGTFRTTVTFAGQYRPPTYSLVAGYGDDGLFQVPGAGSALYTGAQAIDYTGRSSFGVEVQTDVGLAPLYGLDYLLIPATPTTSVPPPPPPVPRSITAHLVPLKVGKRKVRLVVEVLFADTGALKKEFLAPFQGPGFRAIQVSVRDAADVAAAEVVVSARKGKRTVTASYPD